METKSLNRRLDRAAPAEKDGEYIFSEAEYRRAVKATDRFLEECLARHQNDPPLTEAEEKEAEAAVARCFAWLDEKNKDKNARLFNPVHVQRLKDETYEK
jgi:hypothetical protein